MRYFILATDYDGTLARDGRVDEPTFAALQKLRDSGRIPLLVTGRQLEELLDVFPHPEIFERIVAENGALIYNPGNHKEITLADAPPERLINMLRDKGVPLSVGRVILATNIPHETRVRSGSAAFREKRSSSATRGSMPKGSCRLREVFISRVPTES